MMLTIETDTAILRLCMLKILRSHLAETVNSRRPRAARTGGPVSVAKGEAAPFDQDQGTRTFGTRRGRRVACACLIQIKANGEARPESGVAVSNERWQERAMHKFVLAALAYK
jgi:hypothetical protein